MKLQQEMGEWKLMKRKSENLWQKEWQIITKKNQVYLHKHKEEKPFFLNEKIARGADERQRRNFHYTTPHKFCQ